MVLILPGLGNLAHTLPTAFFLLVCLVWVPDNAAINPTPVKPPADPEVDEVIPARARTWRLSDCGVTREFEHVKAVERARSRNFVIACFLAAPALWFVGRFLNRRRFETTLDLKLAGNVRIQTRRNHSLFWIPLEYWSLIWLGISLAKYLA